MLTFDVVVAAVVVVAVVAAAVADDDGGEPPVVDALRDDVALPLLAIGLTPVVTIAAATARANETPTPSTSPLRFRSSETLLRIAFALASTLGSTVFAAAAPAVCTDAVVAPSSPLVIAVPLVSFATVLTNLLPPFDVLPRDDSDSEMPLAASACEYGHEAPFLQPPGCVSQ